MKSHEIYKRPREKLILFFVGISIALMFGCGSHLKRVEIPSNANPNEEIISFEDDIRFAVQNQEDILAKNNIQNAREYLKKAKALREKNESGQEILESLEYGRAYLRLANEDADEARNAMPEVVQARLMALKSDSAKTQPQRLAEIDKILSREGLRFENNKKGKISQEIRTELQEEYLDLELRAIKSKYLTGSRNLIDAARKNKAKSLSPLTLTEAEMKLLSAEKIIESDRHDERAIRQAALDAERSAQKLSSILSSAKMAKNRGPEAVAMALENEKDRAQVNLDEATQAQQQLTDSERRVRDQKKQMDLNLAATSTLLGEQEFNQTFESARKEFEPEEADVYRQGNNLVIRIKSMNFKPGQAALEVGSFKTLSKVQSVIGQMDAVKVRVEGHTDSIGNKMVNLKLSQKRAETVANYLISQKAIDSQFVEAEGFGYDKPLGTNKTDLGRAQNRRVDIVITSLKDTSVE